MNRATAAAADPRIERCRRDPRRFALLLFEVALILLCVRQFRLDEAVGDSFLRTAFLCGAGFAIHYWLPLRWKEWGFVALGIGGAFVALEPATAALLFALALLFFVIGRSPLSYAVRVLGIVAVGAVLTLGRIVEPRWIPAPFWPVVGSVFLFRLMIWLYDVKHMEGRPPFKEYLAYFFLLPNWGCLVFPVVDYATQRRSFFARDHHLIAQQGVRWMARGVVHLLIYNFVDYREPAADPATVTSLAQLLLVMVTTLLLYLRLSGTFHFVVGALGLFGYDLPETHRRWLLATSIADFWRRINVYWRDFLVKLVWLPLWFGLRRRGERTARIVATLAVFAATLLLHAWQGLWLTGRWRLTTTDALFWGIVALLVVVPVAADRPPPSLSLPARALRVAATGALVTLLWSMWSARSLHEWFDLLTYWRPGV
jgi:hypothetical protein